MIHSLRRFILLFALFVSCTPVLAAPLQVQKVTAGVYALVGDIGQRSPENLRDGNCTSLQRQCL